MSEYISREKVERAFKLKVKNPNKDYQRGMQDAIDCLVPEVIADIPAADVQPVKHGRWEETHISLCKWIPEDEKEEGHSFYMAEMKCSCCKRYNAVTFALTLNKPDFCQLCGARMDGDAEGRCKK